MLNKMAMENESTYTEGAGLREKKKKLSLFLKKD